MVGKIFLWNHQLWSFLCGYLYYLVGLICLFVFIKDLIFLEVMEELKFHTSVRFVKCAFVGPIEKKIKWVQLYWFSVKKTLWITVSASKYNYLNCDMLFLVPTRKYCVKLVIYNI